MVIIQHERERVVLVCIRARFLPTLLFHEANYWFNLYYYHHSSDFFEKKEWTKNKSKWPTVRTKKTYWFFTFWAFNRQSFACTISWISIYALSPMTANSWATSRGAATPQTPIAPICTKLKFFPQSNQAKTLLWLIMICTVIIVFLSKVCNCFLMRFW